MLTRGYLSERLVIALHCSSRAPGASRLEHKAEHINCRMRDSRPDQKATAMSANAQQRVRAVRAIHFRAGTDQECQPALANPTIALLSLYRQSAHISFTMCRWPFSGTPVGRSGTRASSSQRSIGVLGLQATLNPLLVAVPSRSLWPNGTQASNS